MTSFLTLFRQGHDTAQIAKLTGETEAVVYNMMHRERISEQLDMVAASSKAVPSRTFHSVDHRPAAKRAPLIAYAGYAGEEF